MRSLFFQASTLIVQVIISIVSVTTHGSDLPSVDDVIGIKPIEAINDFATNPNSYLENYTADPEEATLSAQDIDALGREKAKENEFYHSTREPIQNQRAVTFDTQDIKKSVFISNNAEAIAQGLSNKYIDCENPQRCEIQWAETPVACSETPNPSEIVCTVRNNLETCSDAKAFVSSGLCHKDASRARCLSKDENGACLLYEQVFQCEQKGNCEPLRTKGCRQEQELCKKLFNGQCVEFEKNYRCPVNTCPINSNIVCGEESLCMEGDCDENLPQDTVEQKKDFGRMVNGMGILEEVSQTKPDNFTKDSRFIFAASAQHCKVKALGMRDCCQDKGWTKPLSHCSASEKQLQEAGKSGLTLYLGSYKKGKWHRKKTYRSYCVFPSKLAKQVQIQGRKGQLGRGFGSAKHPDCSGLSPEELSKIDFDALNLGEITDEIASRIDIPHVDEIESQATHSAEELEESQLRSRRVD